jgi:hypothetical protein
VNSLLPPGKVLRWFLHDAEQALGYLSWNGRDWLVDVYA